MESVNCPFCHPAPTEVILGDQSWYAKWDKYPVNKGHLLIISQRHVKSYFETTQEEKLAMLEIIEKCKSLLDRDFHPDGYNIGTNVGSAAGQTIMHLHIHLIPRYKGDIDDPRGGVRGVIPEKRIYEEQPS